MKVMCSPRSSTFVLLILGYLYHSWISWEDWRLLLLTLASRARFRGLEFLTMFLVYPFLTSPMVFPTHCFQESVRHQPISWQATGTPIPSYQGFSGTLLYRMGPNAFIRVSGQTILYETECVQDFRFRLGTLDNPCSRGHNWSLHPGSANFAMVDGSVHFFRYSSTRLLDRLATIAGNEPIVTLEE